MHPGTKEAILPLEEGDVVLHFPDRMTAESFEDFKDWAELMIRKAKRSVMSPRPIAVDRQNA